MEIRDLKQTDFNDVNEIFKQLNKLHAEHRPDIYKDIENPVDAIGYVTEKAIKEGSIIFLGADVDGKIVGICFVLIRSRKNIGLVPRICAHIADIAVDENYRRQGIGTALYNEAVKRAKERGATVIQLGVNEFNKEAIDFYKSLGMTVWKYEMEQRI